MFVPGVFACPLPKDYTPYAKRAENALLFELTFCNKNNSHLFGTFHSDSPRLQPLIDAITPYINQSAALWLEIDADSATMQATRRYLMLPPNGPNLESIIGSKLYEKVAGKMAPRLGLNAQTLQFFRPWAIALLVQYPPPEADGVVLDMRLQQMAKARKIPVRPLETLESQFSIFLQMPPSMQVSFLANTLKDFDEIETMLEQLDQAYLQQKLAMIHEMSEAQFLLLAQDAPKLAAYLKHHLIDKRNRYMAAKIMQSATNNAFIAVGALHLPGETGILTLLEQQGVQIRAIKH